MDSSANVIVVSAENVKVKVYKFSYTTSMTSVTPAYFSSFGGTSTFISYFSTITSDYATLYFSGSYNGNPSITKVDVATGISALGYSITLAGTSANKFMS